MYKNHLPSSLCCFLIFFLIFSHFIYSSSSNIVDNRYTSCAPIKSTCGSPQKLMYPFWESKLPDYCGHPGFKLDCREHFLTIEIVNQTYNVLKIDYSSFIFTISKPQFLQGPCAQSQTQLKNSSLDLTLFNFTSRSQNSTLFYDCPESKFDVNAPYSFACPTSNYFAPSTTDPVFNNSLGFFAIDEIWEDEFSMFCGHEIYVPVLRASLLGLFSNSSSVNQVLSEGFEVKWIIDNKLCDVCLKSGGRCGYNRTLDRPMCLCEDGAYSSCGDSQGPVDQTSLSRLKACDLVD